MVARGKKKLKVKFKTSLNDVRSSGMKFQSPFKETIKNTEVLQPGMTVIIDLPWKLLDWSVLTLVYRQKHSVFLRSLKNHRSLKVVNRIWPEHQTQVWKKIWSDTVDWSYLLKSAEFLTISEETSKRSPFCFNQSRLRASLKNDLYFGTKGLFCLQSCGRSGASLCDCTSFLCLEERKGRCARTRSLAPNKESSTIKALAMLGSCCFVSLSARYKSIFGCMFW